MTSLLMLEAVLATSRLIAATVFPVYDDAFIVFRYTRNVSEGFGLVYQPGDRVLGVTSPAFVMVLAPFYLLGLPLPKVAVTLNILFDGLILALGWLTLQRARRPHTAFVFGVLYAMSPMLARASVGGLETEVFLAALFAAVLLYHRSCTSSALFVATLACFIRPEGAILVVLLLLKVVIDRRPDKVRHVLVVALTAGPILGLLYAYYGSIVPQSVVAKAQFIGSPLPQLLRTLFVPEFFALFLIPLAAAGSLKALGMEGPTRTLAVWVSSYVGLYLLVRPIVFSWYSAPVQFVLVLFAAHGICWTGRWIGMYWPRVSRPSAVPGLVIFVPVLFWSTVLLVRGPSHVTTSVFAPLKEYCEQHVSRESTIVATDIGAVGYYCNARILDTIGLVWPMALNFDSWQDVIKAYVPDYVFAYATRDTVRAIRDDAVFRSYQVVAGFSQRGDSDVVLDPARYPDTKWTQDYILLKRRVPNPNQGRPGP